MKPKPDIPTLSTIIIIFIIVFIIITIIITLSPGEEKAWQLNAQHYYYYHYYYYYHSV